jgi:hypothetical protein
MANAKACALAASAVLAACLLTGCGQSLPKTKANLYLCGLLANVFDHRAPIQVLTAASPLRQRPSVQLGQVTDAYLSDVDHGNSLGVAQDKAKAEADCKSIGARLAKGY